MIGIGKDAAAFQKGKIFCIWINPKKKDDIATEYDRTEQEPPDEEKDHNKNLKHLNGNQISQQILKLKKLGKRN